MKKKFLILLIISLIFLTSCSCEYDLVIKGDSFNETITLTGDNDSEIEKFANTWSVPTDKETYNIGGDSEDMDSNLVSTYEYNLNGNKLTFSNLFTESDYASSTAVYNCFKSLTISEYEDTTIISTSSGATCFNKQPDLNQLTINITVDRAVISHNADKVNGKIYTWYITKDNASDKSIDLVLSDEAVTSQEEEMPAEETPAINNDEYDKERYILAIAVGIIFFIGFIVVKVVQKKGDSKDEIDDQIDDGTSDEMDD